MSTIDIRKELHHYIDNSPDDIIAAVFAMLKTYNNDYYSEDIDIQQYNNDNDTVMKAMDNGEFDLHEDVKKALLK